jgi:hypothetical protein
MSGGAGAEVADNKFRGTMPENSHHLRRIAGAGFIPGAVVMAATALVIALLVSAALQKFPVRQQEYHRKAERIAEYGLQTALQNLRDDSSAPGIGRTDCDGGWYIVRSVRTVRRDTDCVEFTAEGHLASVVEGRSCCFVKIPGRAGLPTWAMEGGIRATGPEGSPAQ